MAILRAAIEADALMGGAIKFDGEMLDPPMFGKALQTLLRAHALHALSPEDTRFAIEVLRRLPEQVVRENWPYGVIL
jgi:citrate lyase beta subunit